MSDSPKTYVIFDVDGTLIGGEPIDWAAFEGAFAEVAGWALTDEFFANLQEVTAASIVHEALRSQSIPREERDMLERQVSDNYANRLRAAVAESPNAFPARDGVLERLQGLADKNIPVAFGTGDWRDSITIKLNASGVGTSWGPLVTSSEERTRAEIIQHAASLLDAQIGVDQLIYIGDGSWDLRATRKLGIRFLGTGTKQDRLIAAGMKPEEWLGPFSDPLFWTKILP